MSLLSKLSKFAVAGVAAVGALSAVSPGLAKAATPTLPALPSSASSPQYGVLIAHAPDAASDKNAGLRLAIVSIHWSNWEPSPGVFDATYKAQQLAILRTYRDLGYTIGINPGLNTAPAWVTAPAGSTLVDQNGHSSGTPSYEFSAAVRAETGAYLKNLVSNLGPVSYYMIGYGTNGELEYPATTGGQWWAFDGAAQGTTPGVAPQVGVSPMPGWVPGTKTWKGTTVTTAQVQHWYNWYLGADINLAQWEMNTIRSAGFSAYFQIKMPGTGANPWVYRHRIAADLAPESYDHYNTLNVGQVWQTVIPTLAAPGVVVNVTSIGDNSGTPADNGCQAGDASVDDATNSAVDNWSSARWQSYLARRSSLPVIGESTGQNSATEMAHDLGLMRSCGLIGLEWAFDYQLYGGRYASITDYANAIGTRPSAAVGLSTTQSTFSARAVGTPSPLLNVTLQNTGAAPLTVSSAVVDNTAFSIEANSCAGQTIAPAATCTVAVAFTPQAWGTVNAALTFVDNAADSPESVSLTGSGNGPVVRVGSSSLNLGVTLPGTMSAARTVAVANHGASPLHVGSVTTSGADFAVASNTCAAAAVPVGGSCAIGVTFDPTAVGSFTGSLQFTSDANNSPTTVGLTGTGGAPKVSLAETSYTFGTTKVGVTTPAATLYLQNTGNEPLTVTKVAGSGSPFTVTGNTSTAAPVEPGAHCTISLTFTPTAAGSAAGRVSVTDSTGVQTVALAGTGKS